MLQNNFPVKKILLRKLEFQSWNSGGGRGGLGVMILGLCKGLFNFIYHRCSSGTHLLRIMKTKLSNEGSRIFFYVPHVICKDNIFADNLPDIHSVMNTFSLRCRGALRCRSGS